MSMDPKLINSFMLNEAKVLVDNFINKKSYKSFENVIKLIDKGAESYIILKKGGLDELVITINLYKEYNEYIIEYPELNNRKVMFYHGLPSRLKEVEQKLNDKIKDNELFFVGRGKSIKNTKLLIYRNFKLNEVHA